MTSISKLSAFAAAIIFATTLYAGTADDIAERAMSFSNAFNRGDAEDVAAHYSVDAIILAPDTSRIEGREAIRGLWQAYVDAGVTDLELQTIYLDDLGHMANEIGNFSLSAPDGNGGMVEATGKYVIVWKQDEAGVWYLHWDIWNSVP